MNKLILVPILAVIILSGCASQQTLTKFSADIPKNVCIAKHEAVRVEVLDAIQEGFRNRGVATKVISATYTEKDRMWYPKANVMEAASCDAVVYYVANWHWDLATYMRFASIWVTDSSGVRKLAATSYQAGAGLDKFIDAKKKLLSMVESL